MIARYTRLAGIGTAAVMAAVLVACGGDDLEREAVEREAVEREAVQTPAHEAVGQSPPASVAAPEREDGAEDPAAETGDGAETAERPRADATPSPAPAPPASETTPAGAETSSTDQILRATARTYERVVSLRAEFEQRMRNPLLGRETVSRGTLYQRQPDRFLMEFSDPDGDVIVSDGDHFWLYYPSVDARQVIRAPRGPQGLDLHAQFIGDPVQRFSATAHGRESVRGREAHVLTLVPREPLGYRSLKVWIDVDDHLVRRFELTEENRNVRHFELRDVVINPSLPDRLFQFTPPAGAQVIQRG